MTRVTVSERFLRAQQKEIPDAAAKFTQFFTVDGEANKAGVKESDMDPTQLKVGIKIEMEHTSDPEISKRITLDHFAEFGNRYYIFLVFMEDVLEGMKEFSDEEFSELMVDLEEFVFGE